jgi:hypothetical protein
MKALRVFGALLTALIAAGATEAQVLAGGEFRVNQTAGDDLAFPSVAVDPSGAFVVVWADHAAPPAVRARRFDRAGAPHGAELKVNERPVAQAQRPEVAVDATGRALAVWSNEGGGGVAPGVFGRVFDAEGRPLGPQFNVTPAPAYEPSVAATPSGFVVVWSADTAQNEGGIVGRAIDVAGNPLGPEFEVSADAAGYQYAASVAASEAGSFVVAWTSYGRAGLQVLASRFAAGGAHLGRELIVSASPAFSAEAAVGVAADGRFVVVWPSGNDVMARRFTAAGASEGAAFVVNATPAPGVYAATAAADKSGNFTVLWDTGAGDVLGRRFAADGTPRGGEFPVNTGTSAVQTRPDLASDGTGNLFAAWTSDHASSNVQVYGQRVGGLVAEAMEVDDGGGNGILEVRDGFTLVPSWRNVNGAAQAFEGRASVTEVPAGLDLTLSADATYGTVPNGMAGACAPCFTGSLSGTRPAGHVDLGVVESVQPDVHGQAKRWRIHVGGTFTDVPPANPFYEAVETLVHHSVTGGCAASAYCPRSSATREQMAVFVLVGKEGAGYLPPRCTTAVFSDVPASSSFCPWVEEAARRGAAGGCGGGRFCANEPITRDQMAVLVLRTQDPLFDPPACTTPVFEDVPASSPYCRWIEELARRGAVTECEPSRYCPASPVTREEMARFIAVTFGLELYGPALGHVPLAPARASARRHR